ncbi:hypothetical protein LINGRAHAP2_LOCUS1644 [Linum grandiflorum]
MARGLSWVISTPCSPLGINKEERISISPMRKIFLRALTNVSFLISALWVPSLHGVAVHCLKDWTGV